MPAIPDGFRAVHIPSDFITQVGPLYGRRTRQGAQLGFRIEQRHTNLLGVCHGGMMATLADMLVPLASIYQPQPTGRFLVTVSLQVDYLSGAPLGAWVQGEAQVLRTTARLLFGQGLVTADGVPALRLSGVFKLGPAVDFLTNPDPWQLG